MNNIIKKIAVLVSCIDEEYQNKIICGITDYAKDKGYNISIFNAFGGNLKNSKQDIGEYNIFNLINFEMFNGVILLTNTITSETVKQKIIKTVNRSNICTISIDNTLLDTYNIGIDNFEAMSKLVTHFIEYHKFTRINYISGMDDNCDSQSRLDAYKSILTKHNIPIEEERIYHGNFRYDAGIEAVKKFINSNLDLPQAIVCANDVMALSTIKALKSYGIKVPQDICVSGFDRIYDAKNYFPQITTIERPLYEIGRLACEKINKHLQGIEQKQSENIHTKAIFTQSCGCHGSKIESIDEFRIKSYNRMLQYRNGIMDMNLMASDLAETSSFNDVIDKLSHYVLDIECTEFYLCLCENWRSTYDSEKGFIDSIVTEGYPTNMICMLSYKNGIFDKNPVKFNSKCMFPSTNIDDNGNIYYYSPIHFHEKCLGYCIIGNSNFPLNNPMYHSWIVNISTCIENIRNKLSLEHMVNELDKLYVIDNLSKIYNRNGFFRFANEIYQSASINKDDIIVIFIDLDGLKYINDKFGHNEGDNAILTTAEAIKYCCTSGEVFARFGGDEFVIFSSKYSEDDAKKLCSKIEKYLNNYNEKSDKPYKVHASMGYHITVADSNIPINHIISIADAKMYELKKIHKKHRGQAV